MARTPNSDVVTVSMPVAAAERALGADYAVFEHAASGARLVRTLAYVLPPELAGAVAVVGPTDRFGLPFRAQAAPSRAAAGANVTVLNTPENLRALYGVGDAVGAGGGAPGSKQAVTAFLDQYFDQASEDAFFAKFYPLGANTSLGFVGDAITGSKPGIEAMLDIEYMPSLGTLVPTEFWGFSGRSPNNKEDEPFLTWLYTVGNTSDAEVPLLFSTSYGEPETFELPSDYTDRVRFNFCDEPPIG